MEPADTRVRGGNDAADFDEIFRDHYERLVRSLAVACGDREAAADAVQDAYTRAFARWRRIARYDDPVGWIRHVALNRLRDHFRRAERGRKAVDRLAGHAAHTTPGPDAPDDLFDQLATLPRQQRIAVALYYVDELSVREIADAMGLSDGAVKYHLHAGRATLRDRLEAS